MNRGSVALACSTARHSAMRFRSARSVPMCQAWNLAGFPAIAVPLGLRDGRPSSVQLVSRPGTEALLLGLAAQLEPHVHTELA